MLLADEPLDLLVDQLRALSPSDRRAVLARLSPPERTRLESALACVPAAPSPQQLPAYASDIVERAAAPAGDGSMTAAGREALARAIARRRPPPLASPASSLAERLAAWLRR